MGNVSCILTIHNKDFLIERVCKSLLKKNFREKSQKQTQHLPVLPVFSCFHVNFVQFFSDSFLLPESVTYRQGYRYRLG